MSRKQLLQETACKVQNNRPDQEIKSLKGAQEAQGLHLELERKVKKPKEADELTALHLRHLYGIPGPEPAN